MHFWEDAIDARSTGGGSAAAAVDRFIGRLKLRTNLTKEDELALRSLRGEEAGLAAHRDIIRPGDRSRHATLVAEGLAGRFDQLADGTRQITALHIPGDMCDLHSVAVPHAGWGIEALSKTTIVRFAHSDLMALYNERPNIALAFWRDTTVDASILAKWISALGGRAARARLAHLVCELGIRMEQAGLGTRHCFRLEATQIQLADVLGITPVHLNRSLQTLRRENILQKEGFEITVPDESRLREVAEFDPAYLLLDPV